MKKLKLISLLIIILISFTGCLAKTELEDYAYVIAVGVDKGSGDKYLVSFQIAVPIKIAGEGSKGGKESTSLVTLETDTLYNSISRADAMISKEITLSHNKLIVISEDLAKEGVQELLNAFVTNREIRPKTSLVIYKGQAKELLSSLEPILEKSPARYYDLLLDSNQYTGYAIDNNLFDFYLSSKDTLSSPYALFTEPAVEGKSAIDIPSVSKNTPDSSTAEGGQAETHKSTGGSQNKQSAANPEENSSENSSTPKTANIAGIAVFANDKLVGEIKNEQILSHVVLLGKLQKVNMDIEDIEDKNKTTVIKVRQIESPKIDVTINDQTPIINILIRLECDLITSGSQIDYTKKENKEKLSKNIKEKLLHDMNIYLNKISREYKSDPIGFGKYYRLKLTTLEELEKLKWDELFVNSQFNVNFQIHLDTTQMVSNQVS